jgi:hypothetical protein
LGTGALCSGEGDRPAGNPNFDASDAFTLIGMIRAIPKSKVGVNFSGEYETTAGSMFSFEFNGQVEDALPVKDFLASQVRQRLARTSMQPIRLSLPRGLT